MKFRSHAKILVIALLTLCSVSIFAQSPKVAVESIGMTVSDMDRSVEFYSALTFQKVSDVEVFGEQFEHLEGVFGARMRIVRMQLGNEYLDLTQYLAPPGRPIPADSRSNDLWFQHVAIVVRDMDQAFEKLRALKVQFVSTGPQTLPPSIKAAAGINQRFDFRAAFTGRARIYRDDGERYGSRGGILFSADVSENFGR